MGRGSLLEPALLIALRAQATHGYDLKRSIEALTDGFLLVDTGGLYRALRRLEEEGFVESRWASGEFGPQRREYELTAEGSALLEQWIRHLRQRRDVIGALLGAVERADAGEPGPSEKDEANTSDERKEK
jgi:DNA-binding PadR family transcriptional regulator